MNIRHMSMPFDELELFREEEKYQHYLVETLIYSTKVTLHREKTSTKYLFILTKRNLWVDEDAKGKHRITMPLSAVVGVIKAEDHPELVLCTEQNYDNLRISANNQERCQNIISALAFYFTYLTPNRRKLRVTLVRQNSLLYFERTSKEKRSGAKLSLQRYPSEDIGYVQSKDSPDIFGKLLIQKMQLSRLISSENSHLAHVAKVNEGQEYICHTLDNSPSLIEAIRKHQNLDFVGKLLYARSLEYKMQLFFEPMVSLRPNSLHLADIFDQIYLLYDKMITVQPQLYLSPYMLCLQSQQSNRLLLRQFRYRQLRFDDIYRKFLYQKIHLPQSETDSFINKMYNIGMLLYYFLFGRPLFDHEDVEISIHLKESIQEVPFPSHTKAIYTKKARLFIESCILGRFHHQEAVRQHPWINEASILL